MAWLVHGTQAIELTRDETIVGSGAQAAWRVAGADLLPRHFSVTLRDGSARINPCGDEAVVAVNGAQVGMDGRPLAVGDVIEAGSGRFAFGGAERPEPAPPADAVAAAATAHLADPARGFGYALDRLSTGIGRDASNVVVVRDPTASRFHAEVRREAGGWALHARGSGGTLLNKRRVIAPALLTDGDEIEVAGTVLRFGRGAVPAGLAEPPSAAAAEPDLDVVRRETMAFGQDAVSPTTGEYPTPTRRPRRTGLGLVLVGVLVIALVAWLVMG